MVPKTVSARTAISAAGFLLAGFATAGQAATVTYNFAAATTPYTLEKNFVAPDGPDLGIAPDGPNLNVKAYTVSNDGSSVIAVTGWGKGVGQWTGNGLGLYNGYGDSSHTVDGNGINDLLVLTFASSVKIVSATFTWAGQLTSSVDNFAFFASPNNDGSVAGNMIFPDGEISGSGSGSYNFLADAFPDIASTVFGFGAIDYCIKYYSSNPTRCKTLGYESFKLYSVTVETGPFGTVPEVPLPAGVILLLSGLTGLGFLKRFKSKAAA